MAAAAFFDLDRTLLRRSSALALAGSFRERGVISRRQLLQAAAWQLLFVARGARVYVVSATLQEIVEAIAEDLGIDGALGTVCEVRDGCYTGRALRALHLEFSGRAYPHARRRISPAFVAAGAAGVAAIVAARSRGR